MDGEKEFNEIILILIIIRKYYQEIKNLSKKYKEGEKQKYYN